MLLRSAWFGLNRVFRERLKYLKITTSQYTVLRCLHETEGVNLSALSERISTNKNNCSSLVNRLCQQGLIQKKVITNDRRNYNLKLSNKGKEVFHQAECIALDLQREVLDKLPPHAEEQIVSSLQKITDALTAEQMNG